ncbi:hypothetical protein Tsubulata_028717 [Turnera subulata]|uniref:DUF4283 domain-containing protein n=1 Tax=Turnera subulata TaxID=218843 RepID=A0A9Q0F916_9ROSI|nr:hypothetical protein Tsubulata_028717 [Turnera subulata]
MECEEDYFKALAGGPWFIMGHALSVQPWDSSFRAAEGQISQAVIWARFGDFPPSWYNSEVLHALGSLVGGPMKVDENTKAALRGKFARVAVEVDLLKPLRGMVEFDDSEGLSTICYACGSVCHSMSSCPTQRTAAAADGASSSRPPPKPVSSSRFSVFNSPAFQATEVEEQPSPVSQQDAPSRPVVWEERPVVREERVPSDKHPVQKGVRIQAPEPMAPRPATEAARSQSAPRSSSAPRSWVPSAAAAATTTAPSSVPGFPPAQGLSKVSASPTKPPNLNLASRFSRTPEKEKKKQPVVLPLKKPSLKVSVSRKLSVHSEEGTAGARKLKGARSSGPPSGV